MSRKGTIQISCPNCSHRFQKDVWILINADTEPYLKTALVTGLLNLTRCPKCSYEYFLALPLVYHETKTRRVWCYISGEMVNLTERETLAMSMVEELRQELNVTFGLNEVNHKPKALVSEANILDRDLTPMQTETLFSYLESPRIFDDINEMIEELRQVEYPDSIRDEGDETAQLLAALEALQNVDSDEKFAAAIETHSIFASEGTPAHLRGLSELAQAYGDNEKAEYFNNLAGILECATGRDADADALIDALTAIAEVGSEEKLDGVFLAHPVLSKPESIERLRHAAAETDDENTAQFYSNIADMLEERQSTELPPNLNEALQAFVEADSNEERIAQRSAATV